ncbi:E3 ubiquitin-protein ligase RNF13-like [Physella acuta]|uniref:E3 ubiquitin-protein ligase RNF13-like n=1 Tax=Physella acuta TaxID=109671 RepID=UPI0027DE2459|nr:E3 ubiquitin-protein ligase RNF13-like [Physella acuta]XP_059170506.1 E3 ubiquitin-protein ligase RNF13-like [Physella acuta]XP_059170508.1 E3 ubiquitin-protein ligase RNF13-like [Physella acuta]XP_059170509.1 E3 ubiquitin-protein ligase RNF13-like [Physella acuta]
MEGPLSLNNMQVAIVTVISCFMLLPSVKSDIIVFNTTSNETSITYNDRTAQFGPDFPEDGIQGRIIPVEPLDACSKLNTSAPPPDPMYKWIALIVRGGDCPFAEKVRHAQRANFNAAIVYNNQSDDLVNMGGDGKEAVKIPSTFVGLTAGKALSTSYNFKHKEIIIEIQDFGPQFEFMIWPFVLVVALCFLVGIIYMIIKICRDHIKKKVNRLSSKHLKKIPVRKFKKGDYYDTCAICLDEYEEGEKLRVLPCDHVYHTKCIDPWLTKNKKTCPVCKRRVIPGSAESESSDSDAGGTANTTGSESTPLLQGSTNRAYATRSERRFPRRTGQTNNATDSQTANGEQPNVSVTNDQSAIMASDSEPDLGAVGGVGISERRSTTQTTQHPKVSRQDSKGRGTRADRKRKRHERVRKVKREEELRDVEPERVDSGQAEGEGAFLVDETREERRERRKKKKELKRTTKRTSQHVEGEHKDEDAGTSRQGGEEVVEVEGACVNPGVSEGQDVAPNRGKRHELNEVV